jgi:hypothetical protein
MSPVRSSAPPGNDTGIDHRRSWANEAGGRTLDKSAYIAWGRSFPDLPFEFMTNPAYGYTHRFSSRSRRAEGCTLKPAVLLMSTTYCKA